MYYYIDKNHPAKTVSVNSLGIYKVSSMRNYAAANEQLQQLRDLYDTMGEEKDEIDDESMAVSEAILEQEKQIKEYVESVGNFDTERFAKNLDILLKRSGIKISELESILNLSTGYISRTLGMESKRKLTVEVLWKIAGLFQINVDDLLMRDISEPTKDLKAMASFIEKLVDDTDGEKIRWESISTQPEFGDIYIFPVINGKRVFVANLLPAENCGLVDAYEASVNIGDLHFFHVKKPSGGSEYSLYIYDNDVRKNGGDDADPFVQIMISRSDSTGILEAECGKLMNSIKTREKDFVVSKEVRSYIDRYLGLSKFMDIEEEPPF